MVDETYWSLHGHGLAQLSISPLLDKDFKVDWYDVYLIILARLLGLIYRSCSI